MGKPHLKILGPDGQPAGDTPPVEIDLHKLQLEVAAMLKDPLVQQYAGTLIVGSQLYSWAHQYLMTMKGYSSAAATAVIGTLQQSMMLPDGTPRPFDEVAMADNLKKEVVKFVAKMSKKHQEDNRRKMKEIQRTADEITKPEGETSEP